MRRVACLAGTVALLVACAHTGDTHDDDGLSARQRSARLADIADWDLRGTLIVDDGEKRERIRSVEWGQRGDTLSLSGRGAVGLVGWFRIDGTADQLVIETMNSEPQTLEDPEADLSFQLGWWLPVASLEYWLLGEPDPDFPADAERGRAGTLVSLQQRDWHIQYESYQLSAGLLVPARIRLTHAELELQLTVNSWSPAADAP